MNALKSTKFNGSIDIVKFLMAILVIGIHTEPFQNNIWLDRGFGIITRLCVPFFFIVSSYLFWNKPNQNLGRYIKRMLILYFIWTIIYLPLYWNSIKNMSILSILRGLLWDGNLIHGLWFLLASIVGLLFTYGLSKKLNIRIVFIISIIFLIIGTVKSTYSTAVEQLTGITLPDYLGFRNGLFYAFPYFTLGMAVAKTDNLKKIKINRLLIGFVISLLLLIAETFLFVIVFKTTTTILWLSVLPYAFFFFLIV